VSNQKKLKYKKIEEQYYQRNMKVGTWKGWHDNGKDRFEHVYDTLSKFIFHANKKEWNEAGLLVFERYIDRKGTGFEKKWVDNGTLIQHLELVYNSKEQGSEKNWYPNVQLK
jgi:antitoxin component YwqK of YwqJK toxin-antitoxin module